jgi:hypothetical protein
MEETMQQHDQASPEPPRTLREAREVIGRVLETAGAKGVVVGAFVSQPWVLVELTEPYGGSLEELEDAIRAAVGERLEVEVRFLTEESAIDLLPWNVIDRGLAVRDHLLAEVIATVGDLEALPNSALLGRGFSEVECAVIQAVLEIARRIGENAPDPVGEVTSKSPIDELPWRRFGRHALFVRDHLRGQSIATVGQLEALRNRRLIDDLGLSVYQCAILRAVLVEAGRVEG